MGKLYLLLRPCQESEFHRIQGDQYIFEYLDTARKYHLKHFSTVKIGQTVILVY